MNHPLISVIVPVYGVEAYLPQCVESVLAQTFGDMEVILVDDGSPDGSPAICDEFAAKDCRVRVIHKQNGGLSSARNAGLDAARGDYIAFVDSDDYVSPYMMEYLVGALAPEVGMTSVGVNEVRDGITAPYRHYDTEWPTDVAETVRPRQLVSGLLLEQRIEPMVWNKLFDRRLVDGLRFIEGRNNEDLPYVYGAFKRMEQAHMALVRVPTRDYFYRRCFGSISMARSHALAADMCLNMRDITLDCKDREYYMTLRRRYLRMIVETAADMIVTGDTECLPVCRRLIAEERLWAFRSPKLIAKAILILNSHKD